MTVDDPPLPVFPMVDLRCALLAAESLASVPVAPPVAAVVHVCAASA
jgi:hypothetical protein